MDNILIWVVVVDTFLTLWIWLTTPMPLTQTYYEINKLSIRDIEELIKEPSEKLRREIVEQRLKLQDYHQRQRQRLKKNENE